MGKHFIDPKRKTIQSVFPCMMQIALFWPKLLPALFLKQPCYPCPFEILAEALLKGPTAKYFSHINTVEPPFAEPLPGGHVLRTPKFSPKLVISIQYDLCNQVLLYLHSFLLNLFPLYRITISCFVLLLFHFTMFLSSV
jgi:hypothetical protein